MTILTTFDTIVECHKTCDFGFKGEKFFTSGKTIDPKTGDEKYILNTIAFNGAYIGRGLSTYLVSEKELNEHFIIVEENYEELEARLYEEYHNPPENDSEEDNEPMFSEEELEKLREELKDFSFDQKPEYLPEVKIRLWETRFAPKISNDYFKIGEEYIMSAFAKSSDSDELVYVLTKIVKEEENSNNVIYDVSELSIVFPSKKVVLDNFDVI